MAVGLATVHAECNGSGLVLLGSSSPADLNLVTNATLSPHFKHLSDSQKTIILNAIHIAITDANGVSGDRYIKLARDLFKLIHIDIPLPSSQTTLTVLTTLASAFSVVPKIKIWDPFAYTSGGYVNANISITELADLFENIKFGLKFVYTDTSNTVITKYADITALTPPAWEKSAAASTRMAVNVSGFTPSVATIPSENNSAFSFTRSSIAMSLSTNLLTTFGVSAADVKATALNHLSVIAYVGQITNYGAPTAHSILTGSTGQPADAVFVKSGTIDIGFGTISNQDTANNAETYTVNDYGWLGDYTQGSDLDSGITIVVTT